MSAAPVLLVHGIWDSAERLQPLARGLAERGLAAISCIDLKPSDGSAKIEQLAAQVAERADALCAEHACERIDLVGFSMGALTCRYYLQRLGGSARVRRFVSISGPHAGTWTAYGSGLAGVRQMRPGSALLRELSSDAAPWGEVEVTCLYTRFDLMIVPAHSGRLSGARATHELPVLLHRWMIRDARALDLIADALR